MSLTTHHISSHSTGCPILARVPAQNFSNFQSIHVTWCVCSFRVALLFQNVDLRDLLKVWNSQGSRFTVSLYSLSGWRWAFVPTHDACKACDDFAHFKFIKFMFISFLNHSHQWWFLIVGLPATNVCGKFQRGCLRKAFFMRSGDVAKSCRGRLSIGNLQGHTPCVLHCVPSRATSRPTA